MGNEAAARGYGMALAFAIAIGATARAGTTFVTTLSSAPVSSEVTLPEAIAKGKGTIRFKSKLAGGMFVATAGVVLGPGQTLIGDTNGDGFPDITIDGSQVTDLYGALNLKGGAIASSITVANAHDWGIRVWGSNNTVERCVVVGSVNGGIVVVGDHNTIGPVNVISNSTFGIDVVGTSASDNLVVDNRIGATFDGLAPFGAIDVGLQAWGGAHDNQFGPGNVVAQCTSYAIGIFDAGTSVNQFTGNFVGTALGGNVKLTNPGNGVQIGKGATKNRVGPDNVISGNGGDGVQIFGTGTDGNAILGNRIGVDAGGHVALPNEAGGVMLYDGVAGNEIGPNNVISGNLGNGVCIQASGTTRTPNKMFQNVVGLDAAGAKSLPNGNREFAEVCLSNGSVGNQIGPGNALGHRQLRILDEGTNDNRVFDNTIGVDAKGTHLLSLEVTEFPLVIIDTGAKANTIGPGNVIAGSKGSAAVFIRDEGTSFNEVRENLIGLNKKGTTGISSVHGVVVAFAATSNSIGPDNVIASSTDAGVVLADPGTSDNRVFENRIGTDAEGIHAVANVNAGVGITDGASGNVVGPGNVIAGNERHGVVIQSEGSDGNVIRGNFIGLTPDGKASLPNGGSGVQLRGGAAANFVGGEQFDDVNVITSNLEHGIDVVEAGTDGNRIERNLIGLSLTQTTSGPGGNALAGIHVGDGAHGTVIGGSDTGNEIAFNGKSGVQVDAGCIGTYVSRNSIHDNGGDGLKTLFGYTGESVPWFTAKIGAVVRGQCVAPDGSTIEVFRDDDLEGRTFVGSGTLQKRVFEVTLGAEGAGAALDQLTATVTRPDQTTLGFGGPSPRLWFAYRNTHDFIDIIPGYWDHVGMLFRFPPYDDDDNLALFVESIPALDFGPGIGPIVGSYATFVAGADLPLAKNLVERELPQSVALGAAKFVWDNPQFPDNLLIGHALWAWLPGLDKGNGAFSCVGLTEAAAEAGGLDIVPANREYFTPKGWAAPAMYPSTQLAVLAPGIDVGPQDAVAAPAPFIWRTSGQHLPSFGIPSVPFPSAVSKISVLLENTTGSTSDEIRIADSIPGTIAVTLAQPDAALAATLDGAKGWRIALPQPVGPGELALCEVYLAAELTQAKLKVTWLANGQPIAGSTESTEIAYQPLGPQGGRIGVVDATPIVVSVAQGGSAAPATFVVKNSGQPGSMLNFAVFAEPAVPWLTVTPGAGAVAKPGAGAEVHASFAASALAQGIYTTVLRIQNLVDPSDFASIPVELAVGTGAFWPGDVVRGSIDLDDPADEAVFPGVEGMTLNLAASSPDSGLDLHLELIDPGGATAGAWTLPTATKAKTVKAKLAASGTYRLVVTAGGDTEGDYEIRTSFKLPKDAKSFTQAKAKPSGMGTQWSHPLTALPGTTLRVNVTPKAPWATGFGIGLVSPLATPLDLSAQTTPALGGGVTLGGIGLGAPGVYVLQVAGFGTGAPTAKVVVDIEPPAKSAKTVFLE